MALTELQASVDKNPAMENEYVALTIVADDDLESQALDTSALLKDFIVGRTSVGRSTQIINFDTHKETRWQILIAAKHLGQFTIPAFEINGVKSAPINLQIVASDAQPQQQSQDLFIRTSVSSNEAYVGQLLTYKVKLYLAVDLQRGVLSAPAIDGAQIKQLGDDKDGTEIVNGRRYRVIERNYSVIADNPGKLVISGVNFSGDVLVNAPGRGMFSFQESRPMQAQGDSTMVTINPVPASYQGDWLVADLVLLKEDWPEGKTYEAGQPITRTITLLASNADETSLPELHLSLPADLRSYPETPQKKTFVRDKQLVSQLTQTVAIVPAKAGNYTLPEIKVAWWNPVLNKQQYASLPARHIKVKAASNTPTPDVSVPESSTTATSAGYWPALSGLLALLWLATLLLWWRERQQRRQSETLSTAVIGDDNQQVNGQHNVAPLADMALAAKHQDPAELLNALLRELTAITGQAVSLDQIPPLSAELAAIVAQLQAARYSSQPQDSAPLVTALQQALADFKAHWQQRGKNSSALSSLNP